MTNQTEGSISLDDLDYFWMPNGAPCFFANRENICEAVESLGFQIYYLIGNLETERTVDGKDAQNKPVKYTVSDLNTSLLKVVNNMVGRSVAVSDDPLPTDSFPGVKEEAYYSMPKIPLELIDKLDEFFRLVHAQHGTESIVILTFDPSKNDSSGWGVLVPEQTNTSVHCKYDADSIAILKPDHVIIAGSVHSHPEMSAYASGTDHADQADFDGIHITFGWQKTVNNGSTQHYAEMQLAGSAYKLDIDDVIDRQIVINNPDPEVVEWASKVKKALPPYQHLGTGAVNQSTQTTSSRESTLPTPIGSSSRFAPKSNINIPFDFDLEYNHIVAEIDFSLHNSTCPSCNYLLLEIDAEEDGACPSCDLPIVGSSWNMHQIEESAVKYLAERNMDCTSAIYLWCQDHVQGNFLIQIKADDLDSRPSIGEVTYVEKVSDKDSSLYEDDSYLYFKQNQTLCCGVESDRAWTECKCDKTVFYEDIDNFETANRQVNIYVRDSQCEACAYYYSADCPAYRESVVNFITSGVVPEEAAYSSCDYWVDFVKVAADIDSGGGYYYYDRD